MSFDPLPGFRDFYPEACARRNHIFHQWTSWAQRFDFQEYDIPTLEPLDLFTRKSGEEIVGQLFHFEDQGGRAVALRPELTPSLARMVGSRANSLKRPIKWFNIAENFRYERQQKGRLRSHYQFNADIFGESGVEADADILTLLVSVLRDFGLRERDFRVRLSDRSLWTLFLQGLGLEGGRALEVLSVIDKMERMSEEDLRQRLTPFFHDEVEAFLASVDHLRRQRDLEGLSQAMQRLCPTRELLEAMNARLDTWDRLLRLLRASGVDAFIGIDLGIVRGLAYYTGFVFEAFLLDPEGQPTGRALAGGGRFDHLVGLLGFSDLPAVGFGMGDVVLADALEEKGLFPETLPAPRVYCVIAGPEERELAMADAALLRSHGLSVAYGLKQAGFGKQFKLAGASGAAFALIYGSEERGQNAVKLRDLRSGEERLIGRPELPSVLGDLH